MIIPSRFQEPPNTAALLHTICGAPPDNSIFLSFPSAEKQRERLSGDQKGQDAPSVPGSGEASSESSGRTHSRRFPSELATNARRRPSGDTAGTSPEKVAVSG